MRKYRIMYVAVLGLIAFCLLIGFVGATTVEWTQAQANTSTMTVYWTVPSGVTSVSGVVVGGGKGGGTPGRGGGNGSIYNLNSYSVTPGSTITIAIGRAGASGAGNGGDSSFDGQSAAGSTAQTTGSGHDLYYNGINGYGTGTYASDGTSGTYGEACEDCPCPEGYDAGGTAGTGRGAGGGGGSMGDCTSGEGGAGAPGYVMIEYTVSSTPPVAAFSGTPTSGNTPLTVTFTDASTNTPTTWYWEFGDGSTSTSQNPSHEYSSAGTYNVNLKATNADGSDWENKTAYITTTTPTTVPTTTTTTVVTTVPTTVVTTIPPTTYPTAGPTPISWYNDKTITEIATLHTYSPIGVTQKCVIMQGSTDTYGTVWFVYGGAHNTYNWKTKDQVKGGTYNQTQCNYPLFPGKTYYYRAASASGYGAEYNFTMTALGIQPTSTYGHYAEEFIETEGNITAAGEMIFDPYTDKWGTIFISMVIGMIFVAICLKQNSSATPAILAFIVGVPLFAMMAPEYIKATQALLMVAVAGMIYYVFARRK